MSKLISYLKKTIAVITMLCMAFTIKPILVFADVNTGTSDTRTGTVRFPDVTEHWASEAICKWAELGILKGDDKGFFRPDDSITRAEMAVILDNLMGYKIKADNQFSDVNKDAWYEDAVLKANAAGILQGDGAGHANPIANITREQAAVMLARAFATDENASSNTSFNDAGSISSWAQAQVFGLEVDKYIRGTSNGNFAPKENITRAEVVTIIDNAVNAYYTAAGTYTENITPKLIGANCITIVKADGVIIKGAKLSGDLIIAEGVGNGNFILDGTTVDGKLIARGGSVNSIYIINEAKVNGQVKIERVAGAIRIVSNGVEIANLDIRSEVILEGNYTNVVVAEGVTVEVKGQIKTINVDAKANVIVSKEAMVENLMVAKAKEGIKIEISGTVTNIRIEAPKTEIITNDTAKITKLEVTSTATGSDIFIYKQADIKILDSASSVTVSGDGLPKEVLGTGSITDKETGEPVKVTPVPIQIPISFPIFMGGGNGTNTNTTDTTTTAEEAVSAYENAPITTLVQVVTAEGLKGVADAATAAVTNETKKAAFENRITRRTTEIETAREALEAADLKSAKDIAGVLIQADYTAASWTVLTAALVLPETTTTEVIAKTKAITNAITAVVLLKADLTAYNTAIAKVIQGDYTTDSWTAYQTVVMSNVVTAENTQSEVNTAIANIITEQANLVFAGKADLVVIKITTGALTKTDYTAASWTVLTAALGLPETTNAEVVAKTTAINTAIVALTRICTVNALNHTIVSVTDGVYNIVFTKAFVEECFLGIKTTDNLNVYIIGSFPENNSAYYSAEKLQWIAPAIQGVNETQIREGLVTIFDLSLDNKTIALESLEDNQKDLAKRYIISYYKDKKINSSLERNLLEIVDKRKKLNSEMDIIEFLPEEDIQLNLQKIKNDPAVRLIEEDKKRYVLDIPNDEYYSQQWGLKSIEAYEAWQQVGTLEKPVKVAVIDSGIEINHPDLYSRIASGGKGFFNGSINDTISDVIGHGTGVSGVIAAQTGNSIGIAGVSGMLDISILPLKVFWESDTCYSSDIINALDYAISQDVDVINLSLGSTEPMQSEMEAVQRAINAGIVVVASAGNNGNLSTAGQYVYPASYNGVISVGAISEDNTRSYFSNYNDKITVVAPGSIIKTTYLKNTYVEYSGTSFSAPIVSAIAAVIKGENPSATPGQIKNKLEITAVDLGTAGKDNYYGYGKVDFINAVAKEKVEDCSTGIIDSLIIDRNEMKVITPLSGDDGYTFAFSKHNSLYQYLKGDRAYPVIYGVKSGSKYMSLGGLDGYAINFSLYPTTLEAMIATPSITQEVLDTFYRFEDFDVKGEAILTPLSISVEAIGAQIDPLGTGTYNLVIPIAKVQARFPMIKTQDRFSIEIPDSTDSIYLATYVDYLPSIDGPGWLANNIKGVTEAKILSGIVRVN